jgi:glycosyltransferase involved in cell wall biosynthesis
VKKILFVSSQWLGAPTGGGIGRPTTALAEALTTMGYEVRTVLLRNPHALGEIHSHSPAHHPITKLDSSKSRDVYPHYLTDQWKLSQYLHKETPDLVIAQEWQGLASVFASQLKRAPLISWLHGGTTYDYHGREQYFPNPYIALDAELERIQIESSELVVSPSQFLLDLYSQDYEMRLPPSKVVRYHFPKVRPELQTDRTSFPNLVFIGRLSTRKGFDKFLNICVEAKDALGQISVQIAGESIDFNGSKACRYLRTRGIEAEYLGLQSPEATWSEAKRRNSYLVVTSRLDNSPNTIYEAVTHRIPTLVVGNMNGGPELANVSDLVHAYSDSKRIDWPNLPSSTEGSNVLDLQELNETISSEWKLIVQELTDVHSRSRKSIAVPSESAQVSVIIPTRNRGLLLRRALESLSVQELMPTEVVIVDDASNTDYVSELVGADLPFKVVIVRNPSQRGPGASRNAGFNASTGKIVCFVDDDNELRSDHIKECVETISLGADFAVSILSAAKLNEPDRTTIVFLGSDGYTISDFDNLIGDSHFACKRTVFEKAGGFHESIGTTNEDLWLLSSAIREGFTVKPLSHETVNYRINEDGVEANGRENFLTLYRTHFRKGLIAQNAVRHFLTRPGPIFRSQSRIVRLGVRVLGPYPRAYAAVSSFYRTIKTN